MKSPEVQRIFMPYAEVFQINSWISLRGLLECLLFASGFALPDDGFVRGDSVFSDGVKSSSNLTRN